jgi:hypothetical protein
VSDLFHFARLVVVRLVAEKAMGVMDDSLDAGSNMAGVYILRYLFHCLLRQQACSYVQESLCLSFSPNALLIYSLLD